MTFLLLFVLLTRYNAIRVDILKPNIYKMRLLVFVGDGGARQSYRMYASSSRVVIIGRCYFIISMIKFHISGLLLCFSAGAVVVSWFCGVVVDNSDRHRAVHILPTIRGNNLFHRSTLPLFKAILLF